MARITDYNIDIDSIISEINNTVNKEELLKEIGGSGFAVEEMRGIAEELKNTIVSWASGDFTSSQGSILKHIEDIDIGDLVSLGNGIYQIKLYLNGNLTRPSLSQMSDGAYDIVGLFIKGWSPKSASSPIYRLHGYWHGDIVPARKYKDPMYFASQAIDAFNKKYASAGAFAQLSDDYS